MHLTGRGCSLLLNYTLPGLTVGDTIWLSTHHGYDYFTSNKSGVVMILSLVLSIATNAVTTMMIAYKLWYVAINETCGFGNSP